MAQLYDADGNPVEGGLTPDEAKKLQEDLTAREEELEKLKSKDLNFRRFRNLEDEEKEALRKKMTEKERLLLSEIEDLRGERDGEKKRQIEEAEKAILDQLAGENEDLKTSLRTQASEFNGEPQSPKDIEERYRKAFTLVSGTIPTPSPLFPLHSAPVHTAPKPQKKFVQTDEGKEAFKSWFGVNPDGTK